jgi:NADPH2:quinone reductase
MHLHHPDNIRRNAQMKAVRIHEFGGLDVLNWEDAPDPEPRPHQVLIKVDAAGVNYADLMRRGGNYPGPDLPSSLGLEAAGTVAQVGSEVTGLSVGQRVMAMGPGGQAELVAVNGNFVFPYPETVDPVQAGGMPIVFLRACLQSLQD